MYVSPFSKWFPELAIAECRCVDVCETIPESDLTFPPGRYAFMELYCGDRRCDCRRVILVVVCERTMKQLASISFGFDRDGEMAGPFLDPFGARSEYDVQFLALAEALLFSDPGYVARLERHYAMVKDAVGMQRRQGLLDAVAAQKRIEERKQLRRVRKRLLAKLSRAGRR